MEALDIRVEPDGRHGAQEKRGTRAGAAAADAAFAAQAAAAAVERRDAREGRDLFPRETAELREIAEHRAGHGVADAGHAGEELAFVMPGAVAVDGRVELPIELLELQVRNVDDVLDAVVQSLDDKENLRVNVLFDLDGTLTDPREGIIACMRHALLALHRPVPEDYELNSFIGPPLRDSFRQILASREDVDAAVAAYRDRFTAVGMFENAVYEGIPQALESLLSGGARLFVATSKPRMFAERILEHFELAKYFSAIYGSELNGDLSDKGELISYVLAKSELPSADTVMVGDRRHDVIGALANGVFPAGALWGYGSREELAAAGAEKLYEEPSQLGQIVI